VRFGWQQPIFFNYGLGGNVVIRNNMVYVDDRPYSTVAQYFQEATAIVGSVPRLDEQQAQQIEWMPLGVFAITSENVNASNTYLQLAVSKDGMIAGTYYNESTGAMHPIEGMVDERTQRAAWRAADGTNANIVMETGIFDLTQDEATALVHFGPDDTQVVVLVRLEEPQEQEGGAGQNL
jgi:hypothetical protein